MIEIGIEKRKRESKKKKKRKLERWIQKECDINRERKKTEEIRKD